MKTPKIVHYQVVVSPRFQSDHPRKGENTFFIEKIFKAFNKIIECKFCGFKSCTSHCIIDMNFEPKLHTCRKNYPMWVKRMKKVHAGLAVIDLFYWKLKGGRYNPLNEKVVFATLDQYSGCGVQELMFNYHIDFRKQISYPFILRGNGIYDKYLLEISELSKNDGLSVKDFKAWFKGYDLSQSMAIIHFTKFRY